MSEQESLFMQVASKFRLNKVDLRAFLQDEAGMTAGSAKNYANSVWSGHQPKRELRNLARFLSQRVPYDVSTSDFEDYLKQRPLEPERGIYERTVLQLEGLYLTCRRHSEVDGLIVEFVALHNGLVGYKSYDRDRGQSTFDGSFVVGGRHVYFFSQETIPFSSIAGIAELRGNKSKHFAGMITGLDDYKQEMVSCKMLGRKISNRVNNHLDFHHFQPYHASEESGRLPGLIQGGNLSSLDEPYRYSTRIMRSGNES